MDKEFIILLGVLVLTFLFILPSWSSIEDKLEIQSASLELGKLSFSASYAAPWHKSCYIVTYGPFIYDGQGNEEGNNIFVLSKRTGILTNTLILQPNKTLSSLRLELWCDNNKLVETEKIL